MRIPCSLVLLLLAGAKSMPAGALTFDTLPVTAWRHTTTAPPDGWRTDTFDDAGWSIGEPGFGNRSLPPAQQALVRTEWTTADIWTRAVCDLARLPDHPALRLSHDEDVEVWLNGVPVCARKGYISDFALVPLDGPARQALRVGRNVIAAHCRQTVGGQFLDVQLADLHLPRRRSIDELIAQVGAVPRGEHPRPDRVRAAWANLNGVWEFAFDPEDEGLRQGWSAGRALPGRIIVPFCPESQLSGVFDETLHRYCWYARTFDRPPLPGAQRVLLHFGAVDYRAEVWLNGHSLGRHQGGYDPFTFDVTDLLHPTGNRLTVRVDDDPHEAKPKGKQSAERYPSGCVYMRVTGIWQTVWLEGVGRSYLRDWVAHTALGSGELRFEAVIDGPRDGLGLTARVSLDGRAVASATALGAQVSLRVPEVRGWSPDSPVLYDVDLLLTDANGGEVDRVRTYVGFREVATRDGQYTLNGQPFFLLSALDQGYYPDGLYTPPSDAAARADVEWAKRYGLNNVRKHQIVAEPRLLYWCDKLGLTIWGEMADWGGGGNDELLRQWTACVTRDRNHPCVITWVPTNERTAPEDDQANLAKVRFYEATRALDATLPVIDTSGYCHTRTDICDLHVNPRDGADCRQWWERWRASIAATGNFPAYRDRPAFGKGYRYSGQPVIFSETGNWRITECPPLGIWTPYGYGPVATVADFLALYRDFFCALIAEPQCAGFSYVQLYDVEGEVNGYLTYDRQPKVAPDAIAAIHADGLRQRREHSR